VAFTSGTRLGNDEVTAQMGAGAMGEVYRARDTKLGREVALKVLPELFVSDPERVAGAPLILVSLPFAISDARSG